MKSVWVGIALQESIRDLLLTEGGARTAVEIQIREDGTGGICLAGAIERQVTNALVMFHLIVHPAAFLFTPVDVVWS